MTDRDSAEARRTNLGRGLAALFGDENEDYASLDKVRSSKSVPIEHVHPNALQPRQEFDPEALKALSASIEENGVLQPILVRRHPERAGEYEIVAGERRWRASQMAQLHEVPVVIRDLDDVKSLEIALVENIQREDLSPLEEAEGYNRLIEDFNHTQEDLARALSKSRSHIANTVRLLSLPESVKEMLRDKSLSAGHARTLVGSDQAESLAKSIVSKGLNVRQAEDLVRKSQGREKQSRGAAAKPALKAVPAPSDRREKDADTLALEHSLAELLGLKVTIDFAKGEGESGSITIHYNTLEQLDDVLRRLNQVPPQEG